MFRLILIFLILTSLFYSCDHRIKDCGIVSEVKELDQNNIGKSRYMITVRDIDFYSSDNRLKIYTNTLFQVGDSIKLYKITNYGE